MELRCTACHVQACRQEPGAKKSPKFCPALTDAAALDEVERHYDEDAATRKLAAASARVEAEGYGRWPRIQEVMEFARRLEVTHIGIATCVGLLEESRLVDEILVANGFTVSSVCCKVGSIPKAKIGIADHEQVRPGQFEAMCNPVGQAGLLNRAGTGLNLAMGLCVGHDSLLFRHSEAPVTVLVAKDRVTGHNPVAAIYTSKGYYKRLRGE